MTDRPGMDSERMVASPVAPLTAFSIGLVTSCSTCSAVKPGASVWMSTVEGTNSGKTSSGALRAAQKPASKRDQGQGRDRAGVANAQSPTSQRIGQSYVLGFGAGIDFAGQKNSPPPRSPPCCRPPDRRPPGTKYPSSSGFAGIDGDCAGNDCRHSPDRPRPHLAHHQRRGRDTKRPLWPRPPARWRRHARSGRGRCRRPAHRSRGPAAPDRPALPRCGWRSSSGRSAPSRVTGDLGAAARRPVRRAGRSRAPARSCRTRVVHQLPRARPRYARAHACRRRRRPCAAPASSAACVGGGLALRGFHHFARHRRFVAGRKRTRALGGRLALRGGGGAVDDNRRRAGRWCPAPPPRHSR